MAPITMAARTIECSDQPLDLTFHPTKPTLLAAALVDGTVEVHDFAISNQANDDDEEDDTIVSSTAVHSQQLTTTKTPTTLHDNSSTQHASCRTVHFSDDGVGLWSGGSSGDVACLDVATVGTFTPLANNREQASPFRYRIPASAHQNSPIHVLHELPNRGLLATGDDAGYVRVWDPRLLDNSSSGSSISGGKSHKNSRPVGCVASWNQHDDYVSALQHTDTDDAVLLATSADGTLTVYDLRMAATAAQQPRASQTVPGVVRRSDFQDDELLSLCILKNGRKVVCGTAEGVLAVFSFASWGDVSDRFPGHPASIDAILKVDEDTILTGSSDGLIRVVSIHPDKLIGLLGDNHEGFPIERLQFSCDRRHVGSVTHDNYIRLWDATILSEDHDPGGDSDGVATELLLSTGALKQPESDDEWEDMDEEMKEEDDSDDDDSDSDDSDVEESGQKGKTKSDKLSGRLKNDTERFFDDL
jgi:WD repeat-containing protein 55